MNPDKLVAHLRATFPQYSLVSLEPEDLAKALKSTGHQEVIEYLSRLLEESDDVFT